MDGWTLDRVDGDPAGRVHVVFRGVVDGVPVRVGLDLEGDSLAEVGSPAPFVTTGVRVSHAGLGRRLGWRGINSTLLRKIPVGGLSDSAGRALMGQLRERGQVPKRDRGDLRTVALRGPNDDEVLRLVGELYAEALLEGVPPAKGIAELMGLSPATSTRWIRKSRDRGYIPALKSELRQEGDA